MSKDLAGMFMTMLQRSLELAAVQTICVCRQHYWPPAFAGAWGTGNGKPVVHMKFLLNSFTTSSLFAVWTPGYNLIQGLTPVFQPAFLFLGPNLTARGRVRPSLVKPRLTWIMIHLPKAALRCIFNMLSINLWFWFENHEMEVSRFWV